MIYRSSYRIRFLASTLLSVAAIATQFPAQAQNHPDESAGNTPVTIQTATIDQNITAHNLPIQSHNTATAPIVTQPNRHTGFMPIVPPTRFKLSYSGSLFILPIGELDVTGSVTSRGYSMRTEMETTGFGKLTKEGGLWATSIGFYDETGMKPSQHVTQKQNKKNRRVEINYDQQGNPATKVVPEFGSLGEPPATKEERRGSLDVMAGIMQMMLTGQKFGTEPCQGIIPIFDGKQRYNLRLEYAGTKTLRQSSFKGETIRCKAYHETVSGYDVEDLPTEEEAATPIEVYLANYEDEGLYVPVRFDYRISGIKVNIRATDIIIAKG